MRRIAARGLVPLSLVLVALGCLGLAPGIVQPQELQALPVAWYAFEDPAAPGEDASGHNHGAAVTEATLGPGRVGQCLLLDGRGGLEIASTPLLQASDGFTIDCWIKLSSIGENFNIASKDGEYLLRVDPAGEGGNLSFFVNAGGQLEPRVRGIAVESDTWYHLVATWDGETAILWVNGQEFRARRPGGIKPTDNSVVIGAPSQWGPVGLKGMLDEVKLYNRALKEGEVLVAQYGLTLDRGVPKLTTPRFDFDQSLQGWEGHDAGRVTVSGGRLSATLGGRGSVLMNRRLDVALKDRGFVVLRMAVTAGESGRLVFLTREGAGVLTFTLIPDGRMHTYVLKAADNSDWHGTLQALALEPSDREARVEVESLSIAAEPEGPPEIIVKSFLPGRAVSRAGRPCHLLAILHNTGGPGRDLSAWITVPPGVKVIGEAEQKVKVLVHDEALQVDWHVEAQAPGTREIQLSVTGGGMTSTQASLRVGFAPAVDLPKASYVPKPQVANSPYLVGAHYCPLWQQGTRSSGWELIEPYPERQPALGWYDEANPEVTDWEIKWALEHGIQFFVYCWYRRNQGQGVQMALSHAIHEGLFNSRYGSKFKFCIMWENQSRGQAGVASEQDLLENLLPFWIETYFKHPSYLKVDNKPLLFIYRPEFLIDDLGGVEQVRQALEKMREACRKAGFAGLTILGEYRGTDARPLRLMVDEGLDYSFSYCWPLPNNPTPDEAIRAQQNIWEKRRQLNVLPDILTLSMGWDSTPWHPTFSAWHLPPDDFRRLCEWSKSAMAKMPADSLGSRMVLLDNWNEFGEGHYIAPHRRYGFGYLDAVRAAFTDASEPHVDLVPEDLGLGPYDSAYNKFREQRALCRKIVTAEGGWEPGLLAWWSFDEADDCPYAWDYSGHGLGGMLEKAWRVPGVRGRALECRGGSVTVPPSENPRFSLPEITVECWVKSDVAGQSDKWFVNNVYSQGDSGFRLGLSNGRLCWAVPKTPWSHHLQAAEPLPIGDWIHVVATYDGNTMRLYMNGRECGILTRGGRVKPNTHSLCLGSYSRDHPAFFNGLLDDVRIYSRALTAEEVTRRSER